MSELIYVLELSDNRHSSEDGYSETLFLESSYPFPSPVGTNLFISLYRAWTLAGVSAEGRIDGIFLTVVELRDSFNGGYGPKGFMMLLKDMNDTDEGCSETILEDAKLVGDYLKTIGWKAA